MARAEISYYYKKRFADFKMNNLHCHSKYNHEIMYVSSGKCEIATPENTLTLTAGNYIMIGNRQPHLLIAQNADILNIEFYIHQKGISVEDIEADYPQFLKMLSHRLSVYGDTGEVFTAMRELIEELQDHGEGLCSALMFKRFLIVLCRNQSHNALNGVSYIKIAKEFINSHLCEKITIDDIARHVGLNRSYLQTLFKEHTNKTVIEYINSLRIEKACFIIRNYNLPIIDVAIDCGFHSRQHFMYTFKKYTGKTVGEYRKNLLS